MGYNKCKVCHDWHWDEQPCSPIFKVFDDDYMGEKSKSFHASDHEAAAIKYAKYYNEGCDYTLMNEEREVTVEDDKGKRKIFVISAEPDIHYSASEK